MPERILSLFAVLLDGAPEPAARLEVPIAPGDQDVIVVCEIRDGHLTMRVSVDEDRAA